MITYTFEQFEQRIKEIAREIMENKKITSIYGISRGGLIPAVRLSHLTGLPLNSLPIETTAIIDDCIDSGKTRTLFSFFPHYFVLIDKTKLENPKEWIEFWWETNDGN